MYVVKAGGDAFSLLHDAPMGDDGDRELRGSPIAANGSLYVRTGRHLYCIAK
jgi:hypothetical protein